MMDFPASLSALSDRYDIVLCDVWGVIHNGVESFPQACDALVRWGQTVGPVVLISNAPRPSYDVVSQLDGLGVPRAAWSGFVTSGDATRALLDARAPGKVWRIGPDRDAPLYAGFDLDLGGSCEDADFIGCSGLYDDETEVPEDYRDRLAVAAQRGLTFICANPDRVVQRGDKLIFCAGALADLYESLGGAVIMAGKPFAPIYDLAIAKAAELTGKPVDRTRVLCIGDGVITDVLGAQNQDLA
ncbi:MAG: TIGR01459 family HAD-type hydrolase, partial [Alphaproteobacteria bacterium]|nr:TIGR01459 family HAD-type hydrolase [Alphaproteobacteria bacterium]